jgi:hypothetical protein
MTILNEQMQVELVPSVLPRWNMISEEENLTSQFLPPL